MSPGITWSPERDRPTSTTLRTFLAVIYLLGIMALGWKFLYLPAAERENVPEVTTVNEVLL